MVLYEMATGKPCFASETSGAILEAIFTKDPAPIRAQNPHVTPEFERIVSKALERDRDLRYQSAADLRSDLKRAEREPWVIRRLNTALLGHNCPHWREDCDFSLLVATARPLASSSGPCPDFVNPRTRPDTVATAGCVVAASVFGDSSRCQEISNFLRIHPLTE